MCTEHKNQLHNNTLTTPPVFIVVIFTFSFFLWEWESGTLFQCARDWCPYRSFLQKQMKYRLFGNRISLDRNKKSAIHEKCTIFHAASIKYRQFLWMAFLKTNIFPQNRNQVINISREHNRGERGKTICISIFPPFGLAISHPGGPNGGCMHFNARYLMISQYVTLHLHNHKQSWYTRAIYSPTLNRHQAKIACPKDLLPDFLIPQERWLGKIATK